MRSLRTQLICGMALGTAGVLLVSSALLYSLIAGSLRAQFDESLAARARSLSALVEEDEAGVSFELAELPPPETPDERARRAALEGDEQFQFWRADGTVLARCQSLGTADLPYNRDAAEVPVFSDAEAGGGPRSRLVALTFEPRRDPDAAPSAQAAPVTLAVLRPLANLHATLAGVRNLLIGVSVVAVAGCVLVVVVVVNRSLRPLRDLGRQIASIDEGDLAGRIRSGALPLEVRPIAERLNELLARLEAAFTRERRFTGDVAHELRTPLAGLRSKLELALTRERSPAAYRESLGDCLTISGQTQRIVENLLQLARADAGQVEVRREPIDVAGLARECWQPLSEGAASRGVVVEWRLDRIPMIETDRDKLAVIVRNLLENAASYVDDAGRITISAGGESDTIALSVANTGCRLSADQIQHVGERFWRGSATTERDGAHHCGLGLALSHALTITLGGSLRACLPATGQFSITLRLPNRLDARVVDATDTAARAA